jgi:hypothetical protein
MTELSKSDVRQRVEATCGHIIRQLQLVDESANEPAGESLGLLIARLGEIHENLGVLIEALRNDLIELNQ